MKLFPASFKRLFSGFDGGITQFVAQRGERWLSIVVDGENRAFALHAGGRADFGGALHGDAENFCIGNARDLHAEELSKGPAGVVIWSFLGIVGTPILIIEESVGNARVGLIHAHDVAASGKLAG